MHMKYPYFRQTIESLVKDNKGEGGNMCGNYFALLPPLSPLTWDYFSL